MSKCPASSTVNTGLAALLGGKNLRWYVAGGRDRGRAVVAMAATELPQTQLGEIRGHQRDRAW